VYPPAFHLSCPCLHVAHLNTCAKGANFIVNRHKTREDTIVPKYYILTQPYFWPGLYVSSSHKNWLEQTSTNFVRFMPRTLGVLKPKRSPTMSLGVNFTISTWTPVPNLTKFYRYLATCSRLVMDVSQLKLGRFFPAGLDSKLAFQLV